MCKTISLLDMRDQLIDTGIICILNQGLSITIPKKIRKELSITAGDEVAVSLIAKSNGLLIQKNTENTLDNIMTINEKGAIRIPVELKRFLSLKKGDSFLLYIADHDPFILLEKR